MDTKIYVARKEIISQWNSIQPPTATHFGTLHKSPSSLHQIIHYHHVSATRITCRGEHR